MPDTPEIVIVGAGFAGLAMGIRLKQAGIDSFTIHEKADRLGGTWRDNVYPGAACDVPSHLYCFSFAPNPDWTRKFSPQEEILAYMEHVAEEYGLNDHIRFGSKIAAARFDEAAGLWRIETAGGERLSAQVLVTGTGQLNRPLYPDIEGRETFEGKAFHSARWDHAHDLSGERVAVIGSAASAIQFVPQIAPVVDKLYLFQRTPNWMIPRNDRAYTALERWLFKHVPGWNRLYRHWLYWLLEMRFAAFRKKSRLGRLIEWQAKKHLQQQVSDPELRRTLTPDYPVGAKRILIGDDFFPTLERDNVELITAPIAGISKRGVVTGDGIERKADTIIYATGFAATEFLAPMRIEGRGGRSLNEVWREGAQAHLGVAVAGFPNLFLMYGPNTNLGHNSIIFMIEAQAEYVLKCIKVLMDRDLAWLEVKPEVMGRFNEEVQAELAGSVWDAVSASWYKTASGKITNNWPGYTVDYWWRMRRPDLTHFRLQPRAG